MKMVCMTAKPNERRDQRILSVLTKFPSLTSLSTMTGNATYDDFVDWTFDDSKTQIDIEVRDETIVERLASELKACGAVVKVYTWEQYEKLPETWGVVI